MLCVKLPDECSDAVSLLNPRRTLLFLVIIAWLISVCSAQSQRGISQQFTTDDDVPYRVEVVATNLDVPWSLVFQGGDLYITERTGSLKVLKKGSVKPATISGLPAVRSIGEGGLMGLAFHPDFSTNHLLYLSFTYETSGGTVHNKVARYRLLRDSLKYDLKIIEELPGGSIHNGCRIRFGPDKKLYITTGDGAQKERAQLLSSPGGKILRVNDDGSIPTDNPSNNSPIYSLGHRNPQGLDWNPQSGDLFECEHGPSGFDGHGGGDEINIIAAGKNYGWPIIHHQQQKEGMETPLLEFTPAIAPSGASFCSSKMIPQFFGNLFVATLRGRHLLRVRLSETQSKSVKSSERMLEGVYGRIRDVVTGPDGYIYFCTSNKDGRGDPTDDDDRVLRIIPGR